MNKPVQVMRQPQVYILPLVHLGACLAFGLLRVDSAWQYMAPIDVPASVFILALSYNYDHPVILFGAIGTLWWYLLSMALWVLGARVLGSFRGQHRSQDPPGNKDL